MGKAENEGAKNEREGETTSSKFLDVHCSSRLPFISSSHIEDKIEPLGYVSFELPVGTNQNQSIRDGV